MDETPWRRGAFFISCGRGERDQFVPPHSSLEPFPKSQQAVVAGDHLSMISPALNDRNVIDLVARRIVENDVGADIGDSALRAMERGEFNRIIDDRLKHAKELDSAALVQLAIALDAVGRRKEAEDVLVGANRNVSDVYGTIAGRRKRMWLLERREADAVAAMENYSKGLELATTGPGKKNSLRPIITGSISLSSNSYTTATATLRAIALGKCSRCAINAKRRASPTNG
jgi:hypothetical protein